MKRIRNSRAARILSWFLTWVMVMPLFCGMFAPKSASAQGTPQAPGGTLLTVIVIDFVNKSGTGGDALARFATDAVAVELASTQRFEVLRREEVTRAAETLGFRAPYDQAQLARLAQQLTATAIVTGEVASVKVETKKGQEKTVSAGLRIKVMDPTSSELINGAATLGTAIAKPGLSDTEALASEAVGKATVSGVRNIVSYTLPEGIVLNTLGSETLQVLINRGSRDGVQPGQDMLVMRDGVRVARIKVTNVFPTDSEARSVDLGLGIRPTDKVRAVFTMPPIPGGPGVITGPTPHHSGNALSTLGKFVVIIALGILVATALKSGGSVTGVTAEADYQNGSPAVQIHWKDNLFAGNTLEYHIWRVPDDPFNFQGTPIAAVQLQRNYTDFPAPFSYWDGVRSFLQPPLNTGNNGGNQQGNGTATAVTPALNFNAGFVVGRSYVYQVSGVVRRTALSNGNQNGGGGQTQTLEDIETNPVASGQVTPVNPPFLDLPRDAASNVNLTTVSFTWLTRAGADTYMLELSSDRTFLNRNAITQIGPFFSSSTSAEGIIMPQPSTPINLTTNPVLRRDPIFLNFVNRAPGAQRPTVYWRVGARNSTDAPGPRDWFKADKADRTFRFIYSNPRSFTPADLPPPPP